RNLRRGATPLAIAAQHFRELPERHISQEVADVAALITVLRELAVADLIHGRVVADHGDVGNTETVRGLHVERSHAERAVAVVAEHFLVGIRKPCCDGEPGADAKRAQRSRIHPLTWRTRPYGLGRDRHDVAAVPDID